MNSPSTKPRNIRCADGDPACDLDGVANGQCNFQVSVCAFTNAGKLLLEASAFPRNLINRTPTNANADAQGWKRITQLGPMSGDPATS